MGDFLRGAVPGDDVKTYQKKSKGASESILVFLWEKKTIPQNECRLEFDQSSQQVYNFTARQSEMNRTNHDNDVPLFFNVAGKGHFQQHEASFLHVGRGGEGRGGEGKRRRREGEGRGGEEEEKGRGGKSGR